MSKKNKSTGFTKQNVRDLSYIKGKSSGIRLAHPPGMGENCEHSDSSCHRHPVSGVVVCKDCGSLWDEEGIPI